MRRTSEETGEVGREHFLSRLLDYELDRHQQSAPAHIAYDRNALR